MSKWSPPGLTKVACVEVRAAVTTAIYKELRLGNRAGIPIPYNGPGPVCDFFTTVFAAAAHQEDDPPPRYVSNAPPERPRVPSNTPAHDPPAYEPPEDPVPPPPPDDEPVDEIPPPPPEVSPSERREFLNQQLVNALRDPAGRNIGPVLDQLRSEWRAAPGLEGFSVEASRLNNAISEMWRGPYPLYEALRIFVRQVASWPELTAGERNRFLYPVLHEEFSRSPSPWKVAAAVLFGILESDAQPQEKRELIAQFGVTPTAAINVLEEVKRPSRLALAAALSKAEKRLQHHEALLASERGVVLSKGQLPPHSELRAWSTLPGDMMLCASKVKLPGQRAHLARVEGNFDECRHFYEIPIDDLEVLTAWRALQDKAKAKANPKAV